MRLSVIDITVLKRARGSYKHVEATVKLVRSISVPVRIMVHLE